MNRYEEQTNLLDDLTRCLGVDIANYSIEESTDIEDEERRTMLRSLVFSRGMNEYEVLINPYGQIRHFDGDTPPDPNPTDEQFIDLFYTFTARERTVH